MSLKDHKRLIQKEEKNNLAIDFDGVIHQNSKGFHDGTIYDPPIAGTLNALQRLDKQFNIIVHTCKARTDRELIRGKTGVELIWEWLKKYEFDKYVSDIVAEKPRACAYIDDKGIRFTSWQSIFKILQENNIMRSEQCMRSTSTV